MSATTPAPAIGTKTTNTAYPSHVSQIAGDLMTVAMDTPWGNYPSRRYKYVEGRGWCETFRGANDWLVLKTSRPLTFAE